MHGISFTALDFETANSYRASACAVGLAKVRAGVVVETASWLIKPLPGYDEFHPINVGVHGITAAQVRSVPGWDRSHGAMLDFIAGDPLVGHNVSFEKSVISKANEACGLPAPAFDFHCTLNLARRHLDLPSYKLSHVATALGLDAFKHHDAGADAVASAGIAIALARRTQAATLDALWPQASKTRAAPYPATPVRRLAALPAPNPQANPYGPLFGQTIVFSGDVEGMSRTQAQDAAAAKGACIANSVNKKVTMLVCGDPAAQLPGGKMRRAQELAAAGQDLQIVGEATFRRLLAFK